MEDAGRLARQLRNHVPDGWYHVTSRGYGGEGIYRTEEDRQRFLARVAELPKRFGTEIHAFVLMGDHYHLLVRCRRSDVSETMAAVQGIRRFWHRAEEGSDLAAFVRRLKPKCP